MTYDKVPMDAFDMGLSYVHVSVSGWVEAIDETATGESSTGQLEQGATNREADDAGESDDMEDG